MIAVHGVWLFTILAILSWTLCRWLIRYLTRAAILDRPNHRSLHDSPVPRGTGIAIAAATSVGFVFVAAVSSGSADSLYLLLIFGAGFALLGWLDDHRRKSVLFRLSIQIALSLAFISAVQIKNSGATVAWWECLALALAMVWHVNLFNFMDGADGFAGTHALTVTLGIAGLGFYQNTNFTAEWGICVGGAVAGYLWWNWSPARVFMGDSGSYFLGFHLAAIVILSHGSQTVPFLILLAPFVVDATLTLGKRIFHGKAWWQGHRQHAYQRLVLSGWSPQRVSLALAVYNVFVCWPLALAATTVSGKALAATAAYGLAAMMWVFVQLRIKADS